MVAPDKLVDSSMDKGESKGASDNQAESVTNGNQEPPASNQCVTSANCEDSGRQPSYVALACCISGYTTLHYDTAKQRQGFRSHPVSPIRPATNGNENNFCKSDSGNYLSPNSNELNFAMQSDGKGVDVLPGCGSLRSPRHLLGMSVTSESRRNFTSSMMSENYSTSYSSSSSSSSGVTSGHYSSHHFSTTSSSATVNSSFHREVTSNSTHTSTYSSSLFSTDMTNGDSRLLAAAKSPAQVSPSSFIVQRVERLYGPGALAQGFYSPRRISTISKESKGSSLSNGCQKSDSSDSLPVLKLLRPEFRAQLTVASRKSRGPADIKPSVDSDDNHLESNESLKTNEPAQPGDSDEVDDAPTDKTKAVFLEEIRDGNYYLKLLDTKVKELEGLAQRAEEDLPQCPNDEGCGMLRAASGKARLLIAEKLNQFRGLCHNNLKQSEKDDFPTTNEDLAGFWDMVLIQVKEVLAQFEELERAKNNGWKLDDSVQNRPKTEINSVAGKGAIAPQKKYGTVRKTAAPSSSESNKASSELRKARDEARRKLIEEKRLAMKSMKQGGDATVFIV